MHGISSRAAAALALPAAGAAAALWLPWGHALQTLLLLGGAAIAIHLVVQRALERDLGARAPAFAALASAGAGPAIAYAAARRLAPAPLVVGDVALATALAFGGVALACALASRACMKRLKAPRRGVTAWATMVAASGCALTFVHWTTALETPAPTASWTSAARHGGTTFYETRPEPAPGFAVGRSCMGQSCFAYVQRDGEVRSIGPLFPAEAELALRHEPAFGALILTADERPIAIAGERLSDAGWEEPALRGPLAPSPSSFAALAAAALLGFGASLLYRRRIARELRRVPELPEGELDEAGWLHLDGAEAPRRVGVPENAGPALLLDGGSAPGAYRGERVDADTTLYLGSRAELTSSLAHAIAALDARAFAWVVVLSAPAWWAAAARWLG